MALKSISISKLENSEVVMFAKSVLQIVQKLPTGGEGHVIHELAPELVNRINILEERLGSKVVFTDSISPYDADLARDREFSDFSDLVFGMQHYKSPEKAAAAQKLIAALESHPVNVRDAYDKESLDLDGFINELSKDDYLAAMTTLDILDNFKTLASSQAAFLDSRNDKISQKSALNAPQLADSIRKIRIKLTNLLNVLSALEENSPDRYAATVNEVNIVITEYHARVQARRTRKENQEATLAAA